MTKAKALAKSCFKFLYEKSENEEHLAVKYRDNSQFFGYYYKPTFVHIDEAIEYIRIRLESITDPTDRILFIDSLKSIFEKRRSQFIPNRHTIEKYQYDIEKWEENLSRLKGWLNGKIMIDSESYNNPQKFEDLFIHQQNFPALMSLLEQLNPPIISNGKFTRRQKGSVTALREVLFEKGLLREKSKDELFAKLISTAIPGLRVAGRTLRNPTTKEYNLYKEQISAALDEAIKAKIITL